MKNLKIGIPLYFAGLFIMTIGISLSVKSDLGVSPLSTIPYTMTCVWGIEMGNATIIFHCVLVLIQLIVLRKDFSLLILLQIPVGIVFGKCTTFCNYLVSFLPDVQNIPIRLLMIIASCVLVALGIFLYVPTNIVPLAGEGCMTAVSRVAGIEFSKVKIVFDCLMVCISAAVSLITIHEWASVGVGTVIAAILVGIILGFMVRKFGPIRDRILGCAQFSDM